jgi:hypothetical protein
LCSKTENFSIPFKKKKMGARNQKRVGKISVLAVQSLFRKSWTAEAGLRSGAEKRRRRNSFYFFLLYFWPPASHPTQRWRQQGIPKDLHKAVFLII